MKTYTMTKWQEIAYSLGASADLFILDVPGGAGKSLVQAAIAAHERERNPRRKVLICVPQSHISENFAPKTIHVGKSTLDFNVDYNLCSLTQNRIARLRKFLLGNDGGIDVCTHAGLARLWCSLRPSDRKKTVRHLTLTLDEVHHLAGVMTTGVLQRLDSDIGAEYFEVCPILSDMVRFMVDQEDCKIRLAAATLYRGDQAVILGEQMRVRFVDYRLGWDEYFPKTGIESIHMTFEL